MWVQSSDRELFSLQDPCCEPPRPRQLPCVEAGYLHIRKGILLGVRTLTLGSAHLEQASKSPFLKSSSREARRPLGGTAARDRWISRRRRREHCSSTGAANGAPLLERAKYWLRWRCPVVCPAGKERVTTSKETMSQRPRRAA